MGHVDVVDGRREIHHTPGGSDQPFTWITGRLRSAGRDHSGGEPEAHARRSRDRVSPWSQPEVVRPA